MSRADRRPRRRLDVAQRRAAILDAARTAFGAGAYQQVALSRIAEAADASEALVLRYFTSKAALYVEVVREAIALLLEHQRQADEALPPATDPLERVATSARVYLDFVAAIPHGWAGPLRAPFGEPPEAEALRVELRAHYVGLMGELLGRESELAFHGYLGFLDAACLAWVESGCPEREREPLAAMAVGALRGALRA
ncbi:TetR/AcrR family transcriptional regulator [Pseudonocardia humida]|uniref:TetR/AcrR family transcriptional regulator n=1 Tax=Pseudonocardia humida TaxID=2800819 RepID=A0ABT1AA01_9PSEU|nr:TetR/AcrR family transcriptional regulator [Pseudonocardia humida]MCO1659479.1 TetR/AcrR family transcriptional regulator [Pseudonocardia humida]